ncbi:MAG: YlmH/Sll1252 family protein [Anaeroplasmataceae bacterium]
MIFKNEELDFIKKINSVKNSCINNSSFKELEFLNLREQELVKYVLKNDVLYKLDGGYENAEYKKCIIYSSKINPDFNIEIYKLDYNKRYLKLHHRKILGSLLSLGIKREVIGDIFSSNEEFYIVLSKKIVSFILENFKVLSGHPINLIKVNSSKLEKEEKFDNHICFVNSPRLDKITQEVKRIARSVAQDKIKNEEVKVNQQIVTNTSHEVKENDCISIQRFGRVKILEIKQNIKTDRYKITYGIYK